MKEHIKDIAWSIGHRCAVARYSAGVTQKEIAEELGLKYQTVSAFERGINNNAVIYDYYLSRFGKEVMPHGKQD